MCDKVWHEGSLSKLKILLPSTYYLILISYLTNIHFTVKVETKLSDIKCIRAGVPQGRDLRPTLFNIHICWIHWSTITLYRQLVLMKYQLLESCGLYLNGLNA